MLRSNKDMVVTHIQRKSKIKLRPQYVADQLMIFVKATIVNPAFDVTKETLTTNVKKFGSKCELIKHLLMD